MRETVSSRAERRFLWLSLAAAADCWSFALQRQQGRAWHDRCEMDEYGLTSAEVDIRGSCHLHGEGSR